MRLGFDLLKKGMAACSRLGSKVRSVLTFQNISSAFLFIGGLCLLQEGLAELASAGSQAQATDLHIRCAAAKLLESTEGSLGALVMISAGIGTIVACAFGAYNAATSLLCVAIGGFILRSLVTIFFNDPLTGLGDGRCYASQVSSLNGGAVPGDDDGGIDAYSGTPYYLKQLEEPEDDGLVDKPDPADYPGQFPDPPAVSNTTPEPVTDTGSRPRSSAQTGRGAKVVRSATGAMGIVLRVAPVFKQHLADLEHNHHITWAKVGH